VRRGEHHTDLRSSLVFLSNTLSLLESFAFCIGAKILDSFEVLLHEPTVLQLDLVRVVGDGVNNPDCPARVANGLQ
jgi:hypothetical protein